MLYQEKYGNPGERLHVQTVSIIAGKTNKPFFLRKVCGKFNSGENPNWARSQNKYL
jgi:hypothetical protein